MREERRGERGEEKGEQVTFAVPDVDVTPRGECHSFPRKYPVASSQREGLCVCVCVCVCVREREGERLYPDVCV